MCGLRQKAGKQGRINKDDGLNDHLLYEMEPKCSIVTIGEHDCFAALDTSNILQVRLKIFNLKNVDTSEDAMLIVETILYIRRDDVITKLNVYYRMMK